MPLLLLLALFAGLLGAQSGNLRMYWIDVEGGASTLLVSPSGESLLIDTGWTMGDRDAKRIFATAQHAGVSKIDYLVISHFHADHAGGLAALSKMIPIGRFFDRGDVIADAIDKVGINHPILVLPPTDRIPLSTLEKIQAFAAAGMGELQLRGMQEVAW